ncbi:hypothetical protein [Demequina aestuarii]|uniref:hypothetical protein n=1 Tax=Demequina aestuarii TaxID=327095 RepID=UPI000781E61A|nr:hypothetical protein [Demequina aestuarii]
MADHDATARGSGVSSLTGRAEPRMEDQLSDADQVADTVGRRGSPVNVLDFAELARNAGEPVDAVERGERGVRSAMGWSR